MSSPALRAELWDAVAQSESRLPDPRDVVSAFDYLVDHVAALDPRPRSRRWRSATYCVTASIAAGVTVVSGDAGNIVARLKEASEVPLRSHRSLSMYPALVAPAW